MSKSVKIEKQQIPVESMNEYCIVSERVEIESAYTETKYKIVYRPANFKLAIQNVKTYDVGFIELEKEYFDDKKDDQFVPVYVYSKNSKKATIFEKRLFLKKVLKIVNSVDELSK